MRLCVLFLTAILVSFSVHVSAAQPTARLRDYVLPAEEIAKLEPKDQASYMTFLYNFIAVIELSQTKILPEPESEIDAFIRKAIDFYANLHFIERAEAQCVPGPCPGGRAASFAQFALFGARPAKMPAGWLVMSTKTQNEYLATYRAQLALSMQRSAATPQVTAPKKRQPAKRRTARRVRRAAPAAGASSDATGETADAADSPGTPGDATGERGPATGYRQAGSACLYGGYVSHYEAKSNGSLSCPAPAGKTNAEPCLGTTSSPKFNCNNFGMATGPAQAAVQTTTCVAGKPLADLTVRCVGALDKWLTESPPTTMDAAAYTAWRTQVAAALDDYENKFAAGKKFSDYCENDNIVNENKQKDECAAIMGLFAKLRENSPAAAAAVSRTAAQPAPYRAGDVVVPAPTPTATAAPTPSATPVATPAADTQDVRPAAAAVITQPAAPAPQVDRSRVPRGPSPTIQRLDTSGTQGAQ